MSDGPSRELFDHYMNIREEDLLGEFASRAIRPNRDDPPEEMEAVLMKRGLA